MDVLSLAEAAIVTASVLQDWIDSCWHVQVSKFDLVVSGINRGDNLGLHVIYSGTVGAAREAACKVSVLPN